MRAEHGSGEREVAHHARVKAVFLAALEHPAPVRAAAVDADCDGDDAVRRDVLELLAHHKDDDDLIVDAVAGREAAKEKAKDPFSLVGVLLDGRYRVERFVAEGASARCTGRSRCVGVDRWP